jgi:hypothetical protein
VLAVGMASGISAELIVGAGECIGLGGCQLIPSSSGLTRDRHELPFRSGHRASEALAAFGHLASLGLARGFGAASWLRLSTTTASGSA